MSNKTPTAKEMLNVKAKDGDLVIVREADLSTWAASKAAEILAGNWEEALADKGSRLGIKELAGDVDAVIALLKEWKKAVVKEFKA